MPIDATLSDAEATVAHAWRARCGDRHGPLEQADVDAIAEAAFHTSGVKPTVELIRRVAGGGSPNAIHPKLDAWFRQGRGANTTDVVPAELLQLWNRLQSDAISSAHLALAPARATLATEQQELLAGLAELASAKAALTLERSAIDQLVVALREDFQALQARNDALQADVARLGAAYREALDGRSQLQETVKQLRNDLAQSEAESSRLTDALASIESLRGVQELALSKARAATHDAETRLAELTEIADERAIALHAAQHLATANALDRDAAQSAAAALGTRADQLEHALQLAKAAACAEASLRDRLSADVKRERVALARAQAVATQAREALAAHHATVDALRLENDRLHALMPRGNESLSPRPITKR